MREVEKYEFSFLGHLILEQMLTVRLMRRARTKAENIRYFEPFVYSIHLLENHWLLHKRNLHDTEFAGTTGFEEEEDEPPLLEELGIDPDRIMQKTLAVLNPFHRKGQIDDANYLLQDSDLAGPVAFCLVLAAFLLLAGSKAHFGYVYSLATTSCILMYILQSLMSSSSNITLSSVASVLGYCLLPVVVLAGVGVFTTLRGPIGLIFAILAVAWASLSASRLFSTMSGEEDQKFLIAYPCLLLYGVFTLIIIF